jgi:hypothetical protein
MKTKLFTALVGTGLLALSGLAGADGFDNAGRVAGVTLWNDSGYTIERFFMSPTTDTLWGPDLLGRFDLPSGYHTTYYRDPGNYDVKLIDRDGDQCVIRGIRIDGDRRLTLTPGMLLHCEHYV